MAPKGRRRLATSPRLVVSALLCIGTAVGLVQAGHPWWGWFVGLAGIAVVVAQLALPQAEGQRSRRSGAERGRTALIVHVGALTAPVWR